MKIAFVGIEKDWEELERRDYVYEFLRYHLELPFYYARDGRNVVHVVSDYEWGPFYFPPDRETVVSNSTSQLEVVRSDAYKDQSYDVVIHWRKWFDDMCKIDAVNVINSQDHSYSREWMDRVASAREHLYGILCFPTWHVRNLKAELLAGGVLSAGTRLKREPALVPGMTLGVDTEVYKPSPNKRRHRLLWASDPGRGLYGAMEIAARLFKRDPMYKLHVCWPDYHKGEMNVLHPAFEFHKNLDNGPDLWSLFNECGWLPYTSTFMEPSSRAHRQAMAAGCVVLYPPHTGSPSELIENGVTGIVEPTEKWADIIEHMSDSTYKTIGERARKYAVSENWAVQAKRFNRYFEGII